MSRMHRGGKAVLEGFPAVSEGQAASQVSFWGARVQPLETGTKPEW